MIRKSKQPNLVSHRMNDLLQNSSASKILFFPWSSHHDGCEEPLIVAVRTYVQMQRLKVIGNVLISEGHKPTVICIVCTGDVLSNGPDIVCTGDVLSNGPV